MIIALGDYPESELGLGRVHGEDSEVINDEELGADIATQGALERAVELGAGQVVAPGFLRGARGMIYLRAGALRLLSPRTHDKA